MCVYRYYMHRVTPKTESFEKNHQNVLRQIQKYGFKTEFVQLELICFLN